MRLSPAPAAHNSSGLRPVAAAGAGVQFATGPIHGMRVTVRDCLPALTMQNGTGTGSVAFTVRGWSWLGYAEHRKAGHGAVWRNVTPRNGGNFSGLDSTCLGCARQCSAGRGIATQGNIATRGDIAGQFSWVLRGVAGPGGAWQGNNASLARYPSAIFRGPSGRCKPGRGRVRLYVTVDGNHGHFPKHQESPASRGATVDGMTGSV